MPTGPAPMIKTGLLIGMIEFPLDMDYFRWGISGYYQQGSCAAKARSQRSLHDDHSLDSRCMTLDQILTFVLFAFAISITPGPNNTMVLASGANFGLWPTIPHLLGIDLGFALMIIAVGVGIGGLFAAFPALHAALRYIGALYLLFLAWKIATAGRTDGATGRKKPLSFLQAASFQWVNPKGWIAATG